MGLIGSYVESADPPVGKGSRLEVGVSTAVGSYDVSGKIYVFTPDCEVYY